MAKKAKLWFDKQLAQRLADKLEPHYTPFDRSRFVEAVEEGVDGLELKARVEHIADNLREHLPDDYEKAVAILIKSLGPENPNETGMFTDFYWVMPYATFVEKYGLESPEISLDAIAEITKRNTGEFAIRPFLERFPDETFGRMLRWSRSDNFHLRRLASEGTRPRLPWAKKLDSVINDPSLTLPILENLKDDPVRFVQKSVANHLNDMLKDNYDEALGVLKRWSKRPTQERRWTIKHALRKELKKANPEALKLVA